MSGAHETLSVQCDDRSANPDADATTDRLSPVDDADAAHHADDGNAGKEHLTEAELMQLEAPLSEMLEHLSNGVYDLVLDEASPKTRSLTSWSSACGSLRHTTCSSTRSPRWPTPWTRCRWPPYCK